MAGGPLFFTFWDRADNMAIGGCGILFGETSDFCQKVQFCQIVWVLPNCLQMLLKYDREIHEIRQWGIFFIGDRCELYVKMLKVAG